MGYEMETSEFLFLSLFCNASKNTLILCCKDNDFFMKSSRN